MLPLDVEARSFLGSSASLGSLRWFTERSDFTTCRAADFILRELSLDPKYARELGEVKGAREALFKHLERPMCQAITRASLSLVWILISSDHSRKLEFHEMGMVDTILEVLISFKGSICVRSLRVFDELCGSKEGREKAYNNCLTVRLLIKKLRRAPALMNHTLDLVPDKQIFNLSTVEVGETREIG